MVRICVLVFEDLRFDGLCEILWRGNLANELRHVEHVTRGE
jgi:hypothetical protein